MSEKMSDTNLCPIPGPRALPVLGNILDLDLNNGNMSAMEVGKKYYPLWKITFAGETSILATSVALTNELCDETRFHKQISSGLEKIREGTNDGLFTAHQDEKNWDLAHRLLVPAFGPIKIRDMFPQMLDIAEQLCLKWLRYGSRSPINLAEDFTRATLDTIGLCAMGFRFNSFYLNGEFHPFIVSMSRFLSEAEILSTIPSVFNLLRPTAKKNFKLDIKKIRSICQDIIDERRNGQISKQNDLLEVMLTTRDNLSGERLTDDSIIDNMVTFLIAGHETTSGLLSFTMHYLITTPDEMTKVRKEVDEVVGMEALTIEHLPRLKYLNAVLRESLRIMPTAPGFTVTPYKTEIIGGKYEINPGDSLIAFLTAVHRDPAVYGDDADEFRPSRMLDEEFKRLPPNAWKPFGNGKRGCIGRAFAWQEALLIMAIIVQNFSFALVDKNYKLKIKETLTMKPENLTVYATPRPGREQFNMSLSPNAFCPDIPTQDFVGTGSRSSIFRHATVVYGSNTGTCEALARRIAAELKKSSNVSCEVNPLNSLGQSIPRGEPVIVVIGSYDGMPPENAKAFIDSLEDLEVGSLHGVTHAVFGCGHHDWTNTFHRVPKQLDTLFEKLGSTRIAVRGAVDVAEEDPFAVLESWIEESLWPGLEASLSLDKDNRSEDWLGTLKIQVGLPYCFRGEYQKGLVKGVRVLTSAEVSKKIHIVIKLPSNFEYQPGDHLAILPVNSRHLVHRVLSRFQLGWDSILNVQYGGTTGLPEKVPISAADLLSGYVEIGQLITPQTLRILASRTHEPEVRERLLQLSTECYISGVRDESLSIIDVLDTFSSIEVKLEEYLQWLPALKPRLYTIASSMAAEGNQASLTVSVIDEARPSGSRNQVGIGSNYLLECMPGTSLPISLRPPQPAFRLPSDLAAQPIIMVASGSGISPFRAFLQEMKIQQQSGVQLAQTVLFFGCRGPTMDDLYRTELDALEGAGIVRVFRAFSRAQSMSYECRYVQNRLQHEKKIVNDLWERGARVFVCGGTKMNVAVKKELEQIIPSGTDLCSPRYVAEFFT